MRGPWETMGMIVEFSVENYRSIAEKQTLSFVASKHKSDAEGTPAVEEAGFPHKLLTSVVIYGANASGKSNLLRALNSFVLRIARSATRSDHDIESFRLDPALARKPTRFEITFLRGGVRYQYGFALDSEKVHDEWLLVYPTRTPQLWFERSAGRSPKFGPQLKGEKRRIYQLTRPDALYLSVAAQFNHEQLGSFHKWLLDHIIVLQARYVSPIVTAEMVASGPEGAAAVAEMLKVADFGIGGVIARRHQSISKNEARTIDTPKYLFPAGNDEYFEVRTSHCREDGSIVNFDLFSDESDGTYRYFSILAPLFQCLSRGGLISVDELDDSLHPALVRRIISWFHHTKMNATSAQLLFNTHDTTLLDTTLFRRDQIWFTEKDTAGKTKLYSLLDFSPRRTESLQKGYLEGRYGAIPFLGDPKFAEPPKIQKKPQKKAQKKKEATK